MNRVLKQKRRALLAKFGRTMENEINKEVLHLCVNNRHQNASQIQLDQLDLKIEKMMDEKRQKNDTD